MKTLFYVLSCTMMLVACTPDIIDSELSELNSILRRRDEFSFRKEQRIDSLKALLRPSVAPQEQLELYDELYAEYLAYNFDSTMA